LAAGVLVVAGGFEGIPGEQGAERVEQEQVGLECAHLIGDDGTLPAVAVEELTAGAVDDGGGVAFGAAANVDAPDAAVDPLGAVVIPATARSLIPGHRRSSEAAQSAGCSTSLRRAAQSRRGRRAGPPGECGWADAE
jgi:hypothetical protein